MQRKCVCHFSTTYFTVPFSHSVLLSFLIFSPCLSLSLRKTWSFILSFSSRDKRCWDSSKCISSSIAKWQLSLCVCVCVRERVVCSKLYFELGKECPKEYCSCFDDYTASPIHAQVENTVKKQGNVYWKICWFFWLQI
jgi:hypothetical protein